MTTIAHNTNGWTTSTRSTSRRFMIHEPMAAPAQPQRTSGMSIADSSVAAAPAPVRHNDAIRVIVRPALDTAALDVTESLVGAIASQLWKHYGGNDVVNWLEAERLLQHALLGLRSGTGST
jgi:hypothetical protein